MKNILLITQIVLSVLLTLLTLLQTKGGGFSSGVAKSFSFYRSRRGAEKTVFIITVVTSILLVINSLLLLIF